MTIRNKNKHKAIRHRHDYKMRQLRRLAYHWMKDHYPRQFERLRQQVGMKYPDPTMKRKKIGRKKTPRALPRRPLSGIFELFHGETENQFRKDWLYART